MMWHIHYTQFISDQICHVYTIVGDKKTSLSLYFIHLRKPCDYPFWVYIGRGDLPFCAKEADGQVSQPVDKVYPLNNKNAISPRI